MSSMKKQLAVAAFVFAGVLIVALVVVGTIGYYRLYYPFLRPLGFVTTAGRLEESLRNTAPFRPPTSGALTAQQWSRYCEVESAVHKVMGPAMAVLTKQRDTLVASANQKPASVRLSAAVRAFGEIGPVFLRAKLAQVEAMNRASFSTEEYRWVRREVFASAGFVLAELDLDSMRTAVQDRRDSIDVQTTSVEPNSQGANSSLVSGRRPQLESWLALAFFDL